MKSTLMLVVAAAILDDRERILLQQRSPKKRHGGQWEFPGGKVEDTEKPRLSLVREIEEELAIELDSVALRPAGFAEEPADGQHPEIVMLLYIAKSWTGEVQAMESQEWGWFSREEAERLDLAPMDRELLSRLYI